MDLAYESSTRFLELIELYKIVKVDFLNVTEFSVTIRLIMKKVFNFCNYVQIVNFFQNICLESNRGKKKIDQHQYLYPFKSVTLSINYIKIIFWIKGRCVGAQAYVKRCPFFEFPTCTKILILVPGIGRAKFV